VPSVAGIHNAIASIVPNGVRDSFEVGARKRSAVFARGARRSCGASTERNPIPRSGGASVAARPRG